MSNPYKGDKQRQRPEAWGDKQALRVKYELLFLF